MVTTGGYYSGGTEGYSSGGGGGDGLVAIGVLFLFFMFVMAVVVVGLLIWFFTRSAHGKANYTGRFEDTADAGILGDVKAADANFSEPAFLSFAHLLFTRFQEARGKHDLAALGPYISPKIQAAVNSAQDGLTEVSEVLVGASRFLPAGGADPSQLKIRVEFEATYTEVGRGGKREFYTVEAWTFSKQRGVLSKSPDEMLKLGCPSCGNNGEIKPDGVCPFCEKVVNRGNFQWTIVDMRVTTKDKKPPIELGSGGEEAGTDLPTIMMPGFEAERRAFLGRHPDFVWEEFRNRVVAIFTNLQAAWSSLDFDKARPFEADVLYDTHRYWIERYKQQGLRNCLEDVQVKQVTPCRIEKDAFYERITVRVFASMRDWTVDSQGKVVAGDPKRPRVFTEYWTFIQRVGSQSKLSDDLAKCPHCGAPLKVSQTGICEYCESKVASGDFDWVLSSIEQDESYGQAA